MYNPREQQVMNLRIQPLLLSLFTLASLMSPVVAQVPDVLVENRDIVPFANRLGFSRVGSLSNPPPYGGGTTPGGVHDLATVRVRNQGTGSLSLTGLTISGPWQLETPPTLPLSISVGQFRDVPLRFIASSDPSTGTVHQGTLTVQTNDPDQPSIAIALGGFWQSVWEGGQEPFLGEILNGVFGYNTYLFEVKTEVIDQKGWLHMVGEEVFSPYWVRANPSLPVTFQQLASYKKQNQIATNKWFLKGSNNPIILFNSNALDGQTLLPRRGTITLVGRVTFTPANTFGFQVDNEWSDYQKNFQQNDVAAGCPTPCGHHMKFWPARDLAGLLMPDTWLMTMDYNGGNGDYQDNVFVISNLKPENPAQDPNIPGPLPGSNGTTFEFNQTYPGSLLDKDGEALGFTTTQTNAFDIPFNVAGPPNSYQAALLDLKTNDTGTLEVTSTASSSDAVQNSLVNGLQLGFDSRVNPFTINATLLGPLNLSTVGSAGVFFSFNKDNFIKLIVTTGGANGPVIQVYNEQNATSTLVESTLPLSNTANLVSLQLQLKPNPTTGRVGAAYRAIYTTSDTGWINLVKFTTIKSSRFFAPQGRAGITATHQGTTPIVWKFDRFAVQP